MSKKVVIAGKEKTVRFPVASLIKMKKETGVTLKDLQDDDKVQDIETILAIIWAGLISADPTLSIDDLAESIEMSELSEIAQVVMSAINAETKKD